MIDMAKNLSGAFNVGRMTWRRGLACLLFFLAAAAFGDFYPQLEIIGETNRSALSYQPGEEMTYTFRLEPRESIPENCFLSYVRRGDDGKTFSGKAPATETLTVKTSLDQPGFVNVEVKLVDSADKPILRDDKSGNASRIAYYAGTAVKPEQLSDCGEPADFDAFWARQKQRLAAVPFKEQTECKLVRSVTGGKIYAVSIPCAGPRPATGYLIVPDDAGEKSLPARITFFGYGAHPQGVPGKVESRELALRLNAHGQELGRDDEYYRRFFGSIRSGKYSYAFDPEQNKDPENCFFNGMVLRALRAMEYLKTRPEWNGKDLIASGGSQGGLQTMWAAALDPDVTVALPSITWCCDLAGSTKAKRLDGKWRIQYVPGLDYYDPVFMAKRIKTAKVTIQRAGLGDYTCPPSGLAISYRNLATPKKSIRWVQGSNHGFVPKKSEVIVWTAPEK
ncbi:MAG: acetylxylan esterase [Victivallales bacterium]|nr:acetylxylan esterase [Victivallales bacterium]